MCTTIPLGHSPYCSKNRGRRRNKLIRLFNEQQGLCAHCGKKLKLPLSNKNRKLNRNTATLDHVYDRFDIRCALAPNLVVVACHTCNKRRGKESVSQRWEGYNYNPDCVNIIKLLKGLKKATVVKHKVSDIRLKSQTNTFMLEIPNPFPTPLLQSVRAAIEHARAYVRARLCDSPLHFKLREASETLADIIKEDQKQDEPFWYNVYDGLMSKYMRMKIEHRNMQDENKRLRKENKELKEKYWDTIQRLEVGNSESDIVEKW